MLRATFRCNFAKITSKCQKSLKSHSSFCLSIAQKCGQGPCHLLKIHTNDHWGLENDISAYWDDWSPDRICELWDKFLKRWICLVYRHLLFLISSDIYLCFFPDNSNNSKLLHFTARKVYFPPFVYHSFTICLWIDIIGSINMTLGLYNKSYITGPLISRFSGSVLQDKA